MIFVRPCDHMKDVIKHVSGTLNFEAERNEERDAEFI